VYSQAVEDYLKAIYKLQQRWRIVTTSSLAERMGVSQASATSMVKKLAAMRLVDYRPYKGIRLTTKGQRAALEVIRHHRLMELYLAEALGLGWDEVDREADRLEHALSEDLEQRLHEFLREPEVDPHGDPIPSPDLTIRETRLPCLWDIGKGRVRIRRVSDRDASILRWLANMGLLPGSEVTVHGIDREAGTCLLSLGGGQFAVVKDIALGIFVEPLDASAGQDSALLLRRSEA
jgi:DtxR family Mn-dependent transcriptional regulator